MEIILLNKVENLGDLGEIVDVRSGYGRNYLIPQGKAVMANAANREAFESRRADLESVAAESLTKANARAEKLTGLAVSIAHKAGDEGKLFGSVGTPDIAEAVSAAGAEITRQEVRMPDGVIRQLGEYTIELHLHPEVNVNITVNIVAED